MKKLVFISDYFSNEVNGGAEQSDSVLIDLLSEHYNVEKLKSNDNRMGPLNFTHNNELLHIVSNFTNLSEHKKDILIKSQSCKYIIYEHDFKCFRERHPTRWKDEGFNIPVSEHINTEFYKHAKLVIYQTDLQKEIIEKNLSLSNGFSLNGNLFSILDLYRLELNSGHLKNNKYIIIDDNNPIKGKFDAIKYAEKNNLEYELFRESNRTTFLKNLSQYKGIILMPTILESCSRLFIEAKLMGLEVISRNCPIVNYNFTFESISDCRKLVVNKILEVFNG